RFSRDWSSDVCSSDLVEVNLDIGNQIVKIILHCMPEVIGDGFGIKQHERRLGHVVFIEIDVEDRENEIGIQLMLYTKIVQCFIAYPYPYAETVQHRNKFIVLSEHISHNSMKMKEGHLFCFLG